MCNFYKVYYKRNFYNLSFGHKLIRNYNNIIKKSSYLNVEIGQIYYLKGDECVCIIKTFWIKIIQNGGWVLSVSFFVRGRDFFVFK
jgi:hypothetical protein